MLHRPAQSQSVLFALMFFVLGLWVCPAGAVILADSQTGFSSVQGQSGWYYGYYATDGSPATFTNLEYQTSSARWLANDGGSLVAPIVASAWVHPGWVGDMNHKWAVRRWVSGSSVAGGLTFSGTVARGSAGGDGIDARFYVNGVEATDARITLTPTTATSARYSVYVPTVHANDVFDFAVDDRADAGADTTDFYAKLESGAVNTVFTNSKADFGSVQSQKGWRYGYLAVNGQTSSFTDLAYQASSANWWASDATAIIAPIIDNAWMHPGWDGTMNGKWADRRWVSDVAGLVLVTGTVHRASDGGDGVAAHFYLNGAELTDQELTLLPAPSGTTMNYAFELALHAGDILDFAVDPLTNSGADTTDFEVNIKTNYLSVPEPATLALLGLGAALVLQRRRRS